MPRVEALIVIVDLRFGIHISSVLQAPPRLHASKFLSAGFRFEGTQSYTQEFGTHHCEGWTVSVEISQLDWDAGHVCGIMTARGIPCQEHPIVTFWDGEIVNNRNATFNSAHYNVEECTDLMHWGKFPGFDKLKPALVGPEMVCPLLHTSECVYMRWKEREFMSKANDRQRGLAIAGFYYVCLNRTTGEIDGFYHDPSSMPFQRLQLRPACEGLGFAFSDVIFT